MLGIRGIFVSAEQDDPLHIKPSDTFSGYLKNYNIAVEDHFIDTADDYILHAFRMARPGAPAILIQHGILESAFDWVANRPDLSPAILLYQLGYDVWLANTRGNTYSKNNTRMKPNEKAFWNFSFARMGMNDVPANVNYIVKHTGKQQLTYIGHSQGTSQFFVAAQDPGVKPLLDKHVNFFVALAPVAYLKHQSSLLLSVVTKLRLGAVIEAAYPYGFLDNPDTEASIAHFFCKITLGAICSITVDVICGTSNMDSPAAITNMTAHFPAGTSVKSLNHYEQLILKGGFREYDWGKKRNMEIYGNATPPAFDLSKITVPTALFVGSKDLLGDPRDAAALAKALPNATVVYNKEFQDFSHITWLVGKEEAIGQWFPDLKMLLQKYSPTSPAVLV